MSIEDDAIWSIDFFGIDKNAAEAIADSAKRLGLANEAIVVDPDFFLTMHLDMDTVIHLREKLSQRPSGKEGQTRGTAVEDAIDEWLADREVP